MKRPLTEEEIRVWAQVTATIHPRPGVERPEAPPRADASSPPPAAPEPPEAAQPPKPRAGSGPLEPGRRRRLERGRDAVQARMDLHGFDQWSAQIALNAFVERAHRNGLTQVLVITGTGWSRDEQEAGVIRRRLPEWLGGFPLRQWVSGWAEAHRRHGGEGAFYVTIRRSAASAPPLTPAP